MESLYILIIINNLHATCSPPGKSRGWLLDVWSGGFYDLKILLLLNKRAGVILCPGELVTSPVEKSYCNHSNQLCTFCVMCWQQNHGIVKAGDF